MISYSVEKMYQINEPNLLTRVFENEIKRKRQIKSALVLLKLKLGSRPVNSSHAFGSHGRNEIEKRRKN